MNDDQLASADEALGWLIEQCSAPGEEPEKRMEMTLALKIARFYVGEYRVHLARGAEPYDALMSTVRGELELSPSQRDMMKIVLPQVPRPE